MSSCGRAAYQGVERVTPITQAGSDRVYSRVERPDGSTYIHVEGTNRTENHAFIVMSRHFSALGLPTPHLYAVAEDEMSYDQEDLGTITLFDHLDRIDWLEATMRGLREMHDRAIEGFDFSICYPVPSLDRRSIFWDLNYFKYCFLKLSSSVPSSPVGAIDIDEPALEDDFCRLADTLLSRSLDVLMLRDCQSRNVMIRDDKPYFIDYQGGRRGVREYDLASFLWQARAGFTNDLRQHLLDIYYEGLPDSAERRTNYLPHVVLFRTLQVLGAYGFRGLIERREHFLQSIPQALTNLRELFDTYPFLQTTYPYVNRIRHLL